MAGLPEYKQKIFVDALQALFDRESNADIIDDDFEAGPENWSSFADECGDLVDFLAFRRKGRRKQAQQKWNQSEAGQAAKKAWNESAKGKVSRKAWRESPEGKVSLKASRKAWRKSSEGKAAAKVWSQTETGRAAKRRERKAWKKTETGKRSGNATKRKKGLEQYLNRRIVALDSEGRCPLHMIDKEGRSPLHAYKDIGCKKHLTFDGASHPWEAHELSLIGAATVTRPYGTSLDQGIWETPVWKEMVSKGQSEQAFEFLLSLPERFPNEVDLSKPSLFVMFMAGYDWSMWLRDTPFGKAFEIARQRGFAPPCRRMRGHVFWKKYAIKVRPFYDFKLSELRWPDDPYGKLHKDDPAYKKPAKGQKARLQVLRRITITDTFRNAPGPFVKAIQPLMKRGIIPQDVFDTIEREKKKRGNYFGGRFEWVLKGYNKAAGYQIDLASAYPYAMQ